MSETISLKTFDTDINKCVFQDKSGKELSLLKIMNEGLAETGASSLAFMRGTEKPATQKPKRRKPEIDQFEKSSIQTYFHQNLYQSAVSLMAETCVDHRPSQLLLKELIMVSLKDDDHVLKMMCLRVMQRMFDIHDENALSLVLKQLVETEGSPNVSHDKQLTGDFWDLASYFLGNTKDLALSVQWFGIIVNALYDDFTKKRDDLKSTFVYRDTLLTLACDEAELSSRIWQLLKRSLELPQFPATKYVLKLLKMFIIMTYDKIISLKYLVKDLVSFSTSRADFQDIVAIFTYLMNDELCLEFSWAFLLEYGTVSFETGLGTAINTARPDEIMVILMEKLKDSLKKESVTSNLNRFIEHIILVLNCYGNLCDRKYPEKIKQKALECVNYYNKDLKKQKESAIKQSLNILQLSVTQ